jgi:hypothetical protein
MSMNMRIAKIEAIHNARAPSHTSVASAPPVQSAAVRFDSLAPGGLSGNFELPRYPGYGGSALQQAVVADGVPWGRAIILSNVTGNLIRFTAPVLHRYAHVHVENYATQPARLIVETRGDGEQSWAVTIEPGVSAIALDPKLISGVRPFSSIELRAEGTVNFGVFQIAYSSEDELPR